MRETRIKGSEAPVRESLRVLLVEDSENDALLLVRELRRGGYQPLCERVYTPEDMERALGEAETRGEPFQVVISDYYMPRFGAPEALELLRELGHDVPFIVVSGKIGEDAAVGVMKAGADDYLTKENMSRLCPAIERELREAEVRREREKAERALDRSEDRFRRLVEQAADAIFVHDLDGRIVDVNRQACDSLGYSREELLSMSVQDFEANFVPGSFRRLWEQITSGPPRTLDGIHRRKDGTTFPVEVRVGVFEAEEHPLMLALVRDVSERREAEKKIRETEARYRTLVEQIPAVTYVQEPIESDNPKAVTYMSPQYEAMLGYPPEKEILDEEHWLKVLHPDDRERVLAEELRTDETGEPFRIEYRQIARGGRVVWVRDEATLVRDEDGNPLYWLGVQYDITEQKRTEEDLRSSEERFRVTFEQAAVGIVQVGLDGEWLRYNDKLCDILGYTPEELETVSVFDLISPEDVEKDYDRGVSMLAGEISNYSEEKLIVGKDGRRVWINLTVSLVHDGSDDPRYFIAVLEDIGKRKQAEKDFRLRDRAIAASSNGIVITDPNLPDNPIVYVNPAFERITGYPVDEVLEQNCRFLQGEGDRDQPALDELREAIKEGRYSSVILRNRRKDGTPFWNELSVSPVRDEEGKLTHFVGVQNDVTERQRTQEELRQSEERFKVLAQEVVEGILLIENGRIIDANRSVTEMFGYELEELIGKEAIELTLPEIRELVRRRIADEDTTVYESEGLKKDGTAFPIEIRPRHLPYSGRRIRVTSVIDLTERKRAEDAVRESEKRFRALVQNASDIILVLDAEGIIRYESPAVERVLGYSPEERVGINAFERIHPDDRARVLQVFSENLSRPGPFPPVEYRVRHKDGAWRHLEAIGENLLHDPVIRGVVVNSRDVTERKRAEQTLKKSERRFRHLFENSSDALFIHDERGRFVDCNAEACRALGYTREELLSLSVADVATRLISEEERREGETLWERALRGEPGRIVGLDDNEMRRKDGTTFPVEVGIGSIEYGERRMIFASARDITGRKRAEEALRQSEARLQAILDNTTAVVYIKDEEGRYSLINQRFKELFHVTRDEVLGKTDHDIFPEEVADEFRTNDEEVLRSGVPLEVEEVVPQDDGIHTYVSVKVPLNGPDGTPYAICGISTDITERKRAEEALLMSEERYRAVVEQSAEGIYLLDAATKRLIESNPALQMMLGYSASELKGMHIYDIAAHSQDDLDENVRVTLSKRA
ncbi:MAG TPA: PAS domain S-box protein, partial [Rubrobacter sp.]|nr:PAS domain S-box protein [Rubrobacter sp.]